jgi:hypothetical protein
VPIGHYRDLILRSNIEQLHPAIVRVIAQQDTKSNPPIFSENLTLELSELSIVTAEVDVYVRSPAACAVGVALGGISDPQSVARE